MHCTAASSDINKLRRCRRAPRRWRAQAHLLPPPLPRGQPRPSCGLEGGGAEPSGLPEAMAVTATVGPFKLLCSCTACCGAGCCCPLLLPAGRTDSRVSARSTRADSSQVNRKALVLSQWG